MERKGECCLAAPRYEQAGGQVGRIMLKFRPIAPKPAAMAPPVPVPSPVMAAGPAKGKRKTVPGASGRRGRKLKKASMVSAVTAAPATLKMGDQKEREKDKPVSPTSSSSAMTSVDSSPPPPAPATVPFMPVLSVEKEQVAAAADLGLSHAAEQIVAPRALRPAAVTWVTVEAVTGTWRDGEASSAAACGSVDDESPSFVSDQWGRVTWKNTAFDRAASAGASDGDDSASASESARVVLATKDGAAVPAWGTCAGFACRVRVRHACPRRGPLVSPCDVWRLDAGGYLWRLDLQATLSLSLGGGLL